MEALAADSGGLYQTHCASRHGAKLQGAPAPSLLPNSDPPAKDEELARVIRDARPGKGMPAWNDTLSAFDIASLVQFVQRRREERLPRLRTQVPRCVEGAPVPQPGTS